MKEMREIKIMGLALVKRGANKVNRSVLKTSKIDDFVVEKNADDPAEGEATLLKTEEVIAELMDIYKAEDIKSELGKFLKANGQEVEEGEPDEIPEMTAEEYLNAN